MNKKIAGRLAQAIDDHAAGRFAPAEHGYRAVLRTDPNEPTAALWLGVILTRDARFEQARQYLSRSLRADPNNAIAHLNLGLAMAGLGDTEAAEGAYRRAIALDPNNVDAPNNLGVLLEQLDRPLEAAAAYQAAIDVDPRSPVFLCNLGNALRKSGRLEEAVDAYRRALKIVPGDPLALNNLGAALYGLGRMEEVFQTYRAALDADPSLIQTRLNLAQALYETKRFEEALQEYVLVLEQRPDEKLAHLGLGVVYAELEMNLEAKACFEQVLALDPSLLFARLRYATCIEALGDEDGAVRERETALSFSRVQTELFVGTRKRGDILFLAAAGYGNLPSNFLADTRSYGRITFYPEGGGEIDGAQLPRHDLIFNLIADPDVGARALSDAEAFLKRAGKQVLNRPEAVLRTRRDLTPALLKGISNVLTPPTLAFDRDAVADAVRAIEGFPVLVRPIGSHGGEDLALIHDQAALDAYMAEVRGEKFYLTRYHDYRSADGLFRKYRVIFVDRRIYPLHLCIDEKWKVHYYTSMMRDHAWMRAEEEAFLANIGAAFPPPLATAATAIAERLDLDYAGMDCAITRDGQILVFEANANMLAHLTDPIEMFPYKHRYVPRIRDAFHAMVANRVGDPNAVSL